MFEISDKYFRNLLEIKPVNFLKNKVIDDVLYLIDIFCNYQIPNDETLIFRKCGDIHPTKLLVFPCKTAIFFDCDKNFIYYWLTPRKFPNIEKIYLFSHPCDYSVYSRFPKEKWFVSEHYKRYFPEDYKFISRKTFIK